MSEGVLRVLLAKLTNNEILDSSKGNNPLLLYFFPPSFTISRILSILSILANIHSTPFFISLIDSQTMSCSVK